MVTATEPVVTPAIGPVSVNLDDLVKSLYEEVTGAIWPAFGWVGHTKVAGRRESAQVGVGQRSTPQLDAVVRALRNSRAAPSTAIQRSVLASRMLWYSGHIYFPRELGEKPGSNWKIRKSDKALWVDFQIDMADFTGGTRAEGEAFVRKGGR